MVFQYFKEPINTLVETFKHLSERNVENGVHTKLNTLTVHSHLVTHYINHLLEV